MEQSCWCDILPVYLFLIEAIVEYTSRRRFLKISGATFGAALARVHIEQELSF
jgi:hypothetical protein